LQNGGGGRVLYSFEKGIEDPTTGYKKKKGINEHLPGRSIWAPMPSAIPKATVIKKQRLGGKNLSLSVRWEGKKQGNVPADNLERIN